jgi:hypothetical protein
MDPWDCHKTTGCGTCHKWSEVKVLLKMVCCTCGLTILETRYRSFSPLCCFSYVHFVLICTVVILYCLVLCVCVYMCICGFCNVCVCVCVCVCVFVGFVMCVFVEGFVMCGCFGNMYTVLWLRVFLTWQRFFACFFLSCKTNASVKLTKTGHGPHSSTLVVICVVLCIVCV